MDLDNLSPAPWYSWKHDAQPTLGGEEFGRVIGPREFSVDRMNVMDPTDAEFIALARNAFDVMMRRGITAILVADGQWGVGNPDIPDIGIAYAADPFTALVAADKWLVEHWDKEHVEKEAGHE